MLSSTEILGEDGLLKKMLPDFTPRAPQLQMAEEIERALIVNAHLIIEAGTGIGKTFGYLVPIFLSQKKTIISTGTKNLQDQLFFKDLPIIKKIFSFPRKVVLLKGRANYLCQYRLARQLDEGQFTARQHISQLHAIHLWSKQTQTGDIAEMETIAEDASIWPFVTSTTDNCLNQECAFYKDCFVIKARQQAMSADIVIVNHHLFFADRALQAQGAGELLPGAEAVIFDEAHHVPDIATQFFSISFSSRQLIELARDSEAEGMKDAKDLQAMLFECSTQLQKSVHQFRELFGASLRRAPWPGLPAETEGLGVAAVLTALQACEALLKQAAVRSKGLENCWRRAVQLIERFNLLTGKTPDHHIHWFETFSQSIVIQLTPTVIADLFKNYLAENKATWIFTSATLTVKNNFHLFTDALGLEGALRLQLQSPFDYQNQAILYVPRGLPDTHATDYIEAMVDAIVPVLEHTAGRAFILFTSFKALESAAVLLSSRVAFPLLLQGSVPKQQLIKQFKSIPHAVLLGTSSFWQGVDVRGEALSCVIIDKLPFAAPEDPILKARIQLLRTQGVDPFQAYQLPNAVLALKQGAGRLIRDSLDRGILMICDPRLIGSRYGETFLQSLPTMPRTRDLKKVQAFALN